MSKEALARIKINKLLEAAGWRFFPDGKRPANNRLETKEQAQRYAPWQNCRLVILSNGNPRYLWDVRGSSPLPTRESPSAPLVIPAGLGLGTPAT